MVIVWDDKSLGNWWANNFGTTIISRTAQVQEKTKSQGLGSSCGMIARGGWESPIFSLKG